MFIRFNKAGAGKRLMVLGALAASALASTNAMAAPVQGTLGATSTGSILITASVPNRARLTGLADVTWANQDPATDASNAQNVCVWSNTATKAYTVTATGSGAASAFTLTNGTVTVPYSVAWNTAINQTTGTTLNTGAASASLTSTATHQTCSSGPADSASLIVGIDDVDLGGMTAGSNYTGTLTLLVTPL